MTPHSTFFGTVTCVRVTLSGLCKSKRTDPMAGKFVPSPQPVLVTRKDPNSRKTPRDEILKLVTSKTEWPQILVFLEGGCTHCTCLVTVRLRAFSLGVPVQPVLLRYPDTLDMVTRTWQEFTGFQPCMLILSQLFTREEVEFMPVYILNDQGKKRPTFLPI